jgi:hypothetical protein
MTCSVRLYARGPNKEKLGFQSLSYGHTCVPKHFACLREAASAKAGCAGTRAYTTTIFKGLKCYQI